MISARFVRAEAEGTSKRTKARSQAWVERGVARASVCDELCPRIMVGVGDNVSPCRDFTGRGGGAQSSARQQEFVIFPFNHESKQTTFCRYRVHKIRNKLQLFPQNELLQRVH